MKTWFRKLGMGAVALALAGALGGCDDGGRALIRLFFGINGNGNCDRVVVTVDLAAAGAVISRDNTGALECALNAVLENSNCSVEFNEDGQDLVVVIDDCIIPAVTNLFSCLFEEVDLSEIQAVTSAQCQCSTPGCDGNPPVCVGEDPDPTSCEDCDNGIDDDGNGLTDCEDPNCEHDPACADTTTTTSTTTTSSSTTTSTESSTTTSSTTTSTSSTTSTTVPFRYDCNVVFRLADDVTVGSIEWDTDYSDAPVRFLGSAGNVECASLAEGAEAAFNDKDDAEELSIAMASVEGIDGPTDLAECNIKASVVPVPEDFEITVTEAADPDLNLITPPEVILTDIECITPETTTTTTVDITTTTVDTTTTTMETTTTTMGGGNMYKVTFNLASASAAVGSLSFDTLYTGGDFNDTAGGVDCVKGVTSAVYAPNDADTVSPKKLSQALIDTGGFSAPTPLATCDFTSSNGAPTAANFPISNVAATDVDFNDITASITVSVAPAP